VVSPHQSLEDIVVPIAQIPALTGEIAKIAAEFDLSMPSYGHCRRR
jgi:glycolate oxidase